MDPVEARGAAMRTSGLAVTVSGITVLISLGGLFLIDSKTMRSMAIGAIMVVAIAVIAAITLLPVLISLLGQARLRARHDHDVVSRQWHKVRPERPADDEREPFWTRWTNTLMRRPVFFATARHRDPDHHRPPGALAEVGHRRRLASCPTDNETRIGFEQAAKAAGPGSLGPVLVVADAGNGKVDSAAVDQFRQAVQKTPGVAKVGRSGDLEGRARGARHGDPRRPGPRATTPPCSSSGCATRAGPPRR